MANLQLGNKTVVTQTGSADPVLASNVTIDSGVKFPAGHVIKTITNETATEYTCNNATDWFELTDLRLYITPTILNSKLLIALNGVAKMGVTSGNMRLDAKITIGGSDIQLFYGIIFLNTNAIDDEAGWVHINKFYQHGQTSSFGQLQIDFHIKKGSNIGPYSDTAFNWNGAGTNYASSYVMEIAP